MKINLTKLLYVGNRTIRLNDDRGTTGDSRYIPRNQTTDPDEFKCYSFELEPEK